MWALVLAPLELWRCAASPQGCCHREKVSRRKTVRDTVQGMKLCIVLVNKATLENCAKWLILDLQVMILLYPLIQTLTWILKPIYTTFENIALIHWWSLPKAYRFPVKSRARKGSIAGLACGPYCSVHGAKRVSRITAARNIFMRHGHHVSYREDPWESKRVNTWWISSRSSPYGQRTVFCLKKKTERAHH